MRKLASVLVLLAVVGVGQAGEKDIIERLKGMEANVFYIDIGDGKEVLAVDLNDQNVDAGLVELCELRTLRWLDLTLPRLTDAQLRTVGSLGGLRVLFICGCPVNDAQLRRIARIRTLKALHVIDANLTDDGLEILTGLGNLWALSIGDAGVTDKGLHHLERLEKLMHLDLRTCPNLTDAGVARLQKALPKCQIRR